MEKARVTTSWDDGHILDMRLAALLKKYGISGTFYISPKDREILAESRLSDEQIKTVSEDFEIGAHTMTHPQLTDLPSGEARSEIVDSKKYLENIVRKLIQSFCYPSGYFSDEHVQMVRDAGFVLARTVERFKTTEGSDPFKMPTTVHAYRHLSDALSIFRAVGIRNFLSCYMHWDELAIVLFEKTAKEGGLFHLWGHSWEIDKNSDWERLEKVLRHIGGRENIEYISNEQVYAK